MVRCSYECSWCFGSAKAGVGRQFRCGAVRGLSQVPAVTARYAAPSLGPTGHVRILPQLSYRANPSADRYVTVTSQQHKEGKH
jgi:hypothetical protein